MHFLIGNEVLYYWGTWCQGYHLVCLRGLSGFSVSCTPATPGSWQPNSLSSGGFRWLGMAVQYVICDRLECSCGELLNSLGFERTRCLFVVKSLLNLWFHTRFVEVVGKTDPRCPGVFYASQIYCKARSVYVWKHWSDCVQWNLIVSNGPDVFVIYSIVQHWLECGSVFWESCRRENYDHNVIRNQTSFVMCALLNL